MALDNSELSAILYYEMKISWLNEDNSPLTDDIIIASELHRTIDDLVSSFACDNGITGDLQVKQFMADAFLVHFRSEEGGSHYNAGRHYESPSHEPLLIRQDFEQSNDAARRRVVEFLNQICSGQLVPTGTTKS